MKTNALRPEVLTRLSQLAGPFIDDVNVVVLGLLDHWTKTHEPSHLNSDHGGRSTEQAKMCDGLPVGLKLKSEFRNREFHAIVEEGGIRLVELDKLSSSVSRAAMDLKNEFFGMNEAGASTNGWIFWHYQDDRGRWRVIDNLRKN